MSVGAIVRNRGANDRGFQTAARMFRATGGVFGQLPAIAGQLPDGSKRLPEGSGQLSEGFGHFSEVIILNDLMEMEALWVSDQGRDVSCCGY